MRSALLAAAFLTAAARPAAAQTPPALSGAAASDVTGDSAVISWTTDRPADASVDYGPTPAYGQTAFLNSPPGTSHRVTLAGLQPGTLYHFRARSADAGGQGTAGGTFTTAAAGAAPAAVEPPPGADSSPPSVLIMNPAGGSTVSSTVTVSANASDASGVASVQFLLNGALLGAPLTAAPYVLTWDTRMHADGAHNLAAVARDATGNQATSPIAAVVINNTPPRIQDVAPLTVAHDRALIGWKTDQRADSQVEYGVTPSYGSSAGPLPSRVVIHEVPLSALSPGTIYHYRVVSRDASGAASASENFTFTTPAAPAGGALAASTAAPAAADAVRAPQRFLTPARADGVNDEAAFGSQAEAIEVFDLQGRKVFEARAKDAAAGPTWSGRDGAGRVQPSGVYLVRIKTRDGRTVLQSLAIAK